jgi:hypothetical protein
MERGTGAVLAALLWLGSSLVGWAQAGEFFPLEDVRPGLKGVGKTVFQGTEVQTFDVEILGVLEKVGPNQSLVLAKLSGDKVNQYGVCAGMSGSPVYLDGRLLGAVAYAFSFATEPIAGITPVGDMIDAFRKSPERTFRLTQGGKVDLMRLIDFQDGSLLSRGWGIPKATSVAYVQSGWGVLEPIRTPLHFSGTSFLALQPFLPLFETAGFLPILGGGVGANDEWRNAPFEPGSAVVIQLVRGDMEMAASGTVTHVSGNEVIAFGHPFLGMGGTDLPMAKAAVLGVVPNLMNSQKIAATLEPVGVIRQDRATGIFGLKGEQPRLIPLTVNLSSSTGVDRTYRYEVVRDAFLSPLLVAVTVQNSILAVERSIGEQTLNVSCRIRIQGHQDAVFETGVTGMGGTSAEAALAAGAPLDFLMSSGFADLTIESLVIDIAAAEENREAVLEKVWQEKLEAKAGEEVDLTVFLRLPDGGSRKETYPIRIPEGVPLGPLKVWIGDGMTLERVDAKQEPVEFYPKDPSQLIRAINNLKKNDRLYIRLYREQAGAVVGGEGLPGLPPSLLAIYRSAKTVGEVLPIRRVVYVEHELPKTDYVLSGEKTIEIEVKG